MSAFTQNVITLKGLALLAKAQTGAAITFTRIAVGDGFNSFNSSNTAEMEKIEALVSPVMDLDIAKCKVLPTGNAVIGAYLSNQSADFKAFNFRELGLFAIDPDEGEILYSYANCGKVYDDAAGTTSDNSEYIPAYGTSALIEKKLDIIVSVANAKTVQAFLSSNIYALKSDLDEIKKIAENALAKAEENYALIVANKAECDAHAALIQGLRVDVNAISAKINTLWNAVFSNIKDNPFEITFDTLDQITLTDGVWNQSMARLEC